MLALICGTGDLPRRVAEAQKVTPLVYVLEGFAPNDLAATQTFRLERLGSVLNELASKGVTEVCLCGAITRPPIDPGQIDAETLPLVPKIQAALGAGDDGALRVVMSLFEEAGFVIRSVPDLVRDLVEGPGVPTRAQPSLQARADVQEALLALADMGRRDVGQACVVRGGKVMALEEQDGTDALLRRVSQGSALPPPTDVVGWAMESVGDALDDVADWLSGAPARRAGGLLFKAPKPDQDRRADLPTIGPATAMGAVQAGLDGIVIEAGSVLLLERSKTIEILDRAGAFLWVRAL